MDTGIHCYNIPVKESVSILELIITPCGGKQQKVKVSLHIKLIKK
jgi:hypothetical protein